MAKLGCIGFGAMGSALISGFVKSGLLQADILVFDPSEASRKKALACGFSVASSLCELDNCEIILLAVKPQNLESVSANWTLHNNDQVIVISILAGVTIENITKTLNVTKVIRVMPNLPAQIGKGVLAVNFSKSIIEAEKESVMKLLSASGAVYVTEERLFNAVTALSGSGPAFILLILEALCLGAVSEGLSSQVALEMAAKTMIGTAEYLESTKMHPAALRDLVTSPAGTTAAGLLMLEEKGLRSALSKAVKAAAKRGKELQEGE